MAQSNGGSGIDISIDRLKVKPDFGIKEPDSNYIDPSQQRTREEYGWQPNPHAKGIGKGKKE